MASAIKSSRQSIGTAFQERFTSGKVGEKDWSTAILSQYIILDSPITNRSVDEKLRSAVFLTQFFEGFFFLLEVACV